MGAITVDLNTDTKRQVPPGIYTLRVIYSVPDGTLADTTVAAVSDRFEIK